MIAVIGDGAAAALNLSEVTGAARPLGDGIAFVDPRSAKLGCRLIVPTADAGAILSDLPIAETTLEKYEAFADTVEYT